MLEKFLKKSGIYNPLALYQKTLFKRTKDFLIDSTFLVCLTMLIYLFNSRQVSFIQVIPQGGAVQRK